MSGDCHVIPCHRFQTFTFCVGLEFNANSKLTRQLNNELLIKNKVGSVFQAFFSSYVHDLFLQILMQNIIFFSTC